MAAPTKYQRNYSFAGFQATSPNRPLPGASLDNELENVEVSVSQVVNAINDIRRSDGALKNGIVTKDALAPGLSTGVDPATQWVTGTEYTANNVVFYSAAFYRCLQSHTSGTFATDLGSGYWEIFADFSGYFEDVEGWRDDAVAAAADAAADAATASTAATTASSAATTASTAATNAAASYDLFDDRYLGEKTSLPTVDNDGNALVNGALVSLTGNGALDGLYVRRSGVWQAAVTETAVWKVQQSYTATAGQTTFTVTGGYTAGEAMVFLNGAKLVNGDDVNVSSGSTFVLAVGASDGDSVDFVGYRTFEVGVVNGGSIIDGTVTPAKLSTSYAPLASPAFTGTPTAPTAASGTNTTQIATTAGARIYARDVNPDYLFSQIFEGNEGNADHTALFNTAIAAVSAARGGTIRLDAKEYRLASQPNAITAPGVYIRGVGHAGVGGANGASQHGSVIRLTGTGTQDGLVWGDSLATSGYQWEGGGLEDVRIEARERTGGYALKVNRGRNFQMRGVSMWEVWNGAQVYGSMNTYFRESSIEQVKGTHCIRFTGDAANRSDVLDLAGVFIGAQNAVTLSRAIGIAWEGFAHTMSVHGVRIVNPSTGVLISGVGAPNDTQVPHFGFFHDLEVDFSTGDCVSLNSFKDMRFLNCYFHGAAGGSTYNVRAIGSSVYGVLIISESRFSNCPSALFAGCRDVGIVNNIFGRTSVSGTQYISSDSNAVRVRIVGNQFGTTIFGTGQATSTGVAMASGADRWIVVGNQFTDVATAVQNFGVGALVNANNQT